MEFYFRRAVGARLIRSYIFLVFFSRNKIRNLKNPFKFELGVFAITPFLTYISQIYIYGESFMVIKQYSYCLITAIFYVFIFINILSVKL